MANIVEKQGFTYDAVVGKLALGMDTYWYSTGVSKGCTYWYHPIVTGSAKGASQAHSDGALSEARKKKFPQCARTHEMHPPKAPTMEE